MIQENTYLRLVILELVQLLLLLALGDLLGEKLLRSIGRSTSGR